MDSTRAIGKQPHNNSKDLPMLMFMSLLSFFLCQPKFFDIKVWTRDIEEAYTIETIIPWSIYQSFTWSQATKWQILEG